MGGKRVDIVKMICEGCKKEVGVCFINQIPLCVFCYNLVKIKPLGFRNLLISNNKISRKVRIIAIRNYPEIVNFSDDRRSFKNILKIIENLQNTIKQGIPTLLIP